ncbi:MAG TPA: hypothetical protein VEZ12_12480 [Herpetosiphonaceae bacterium]|nr:hypothetical protein [Herpetosiphonaceae bacterium]
MSPIFPSPMHDLPRLDLAAMGEILVATGLQRSGPVDLAGFELRGHEGTVVRLPAEDAGSAVS